MIYFLQYITLLLLWDLQCILKRTKVQCSKPRFSETFAFEAIVNFLRHCGKQCLISVLRVTREFCLVIVNQIKSFFISLNPSTLATWGTIHTNGHNIWGINEITWIQKYCLFLVIIQCNKLIHIMASYKFIMEHCLCPSVVRPSVRKLFL